MKGDGVDTSGVFAYTVLALQQHALQTEGFVKMKTRHVILSALTMALAMPVYAHAHDEKTATTTKEHEISGALGKPTIDAAVEGLSVKVWLTTQKQHEMAARKDLKIGQMETRGIKDSSATMSKGEKVGAATDSHFIVLGVTDSSDGKETAIENAKVLIVSPSKKSSSVDLTPLVSHGLALNEKGEYSLTVSFSVDGVSKTKEFQYAVK
jgi:hypothetical protein